MIGAWSPTASTTNTSVAAMLYAGATDAVAITVLEISPSAPDFRPLSIGCSVGSAIRSATLIGFATLTVRSPASAGDHRLTRLCL